MTSPLVAASTYNKRPIKLLENGGVDPDKLTRELGDIEGALGFATRLTGTVFNVLDYGADPRGVGDSTRAFQSALDAMPSGGVLWVPPGYYMGTAGLNVPYDNITVVGAGAATILDFTPTTTTEAVFTANGVEAFVAKDFTVTGAFAWAVYIASGSKHRIIGLTASGGTRRDATGSKCGGIYLQNTSKVIVAKNVLSGNGIADTSNCADIMLNFGTYQVTQSVIADNDCSSSTVEANIIGFDPQSCRFVRNGCRNAATLSASSYVVGGYGIAIYNTGTVSAAELYGNVIANNVVEDTQGTGIYVQGLQGTTVTGNTTVNTCSVQSDNSLGVGGIAVSLAEGCAVTGNTVWGSGKAGIALTADCDYTSVTGNSIRDTTGLGIAIRSTQNDLTITGNTVENCANDGIGMWSDTVAVRVNVTGNTIRTTTNSGIGILASSNTSDWLITNNVISNTSGVAISDVGTNNVVLDNPGWDQIGTVTTTYPAATEYLTILADATGGAFDVDLPAVANAQGRVYVIKKIDAGVNVVTVDPNGAETIDGAANYPLALQYQSVSIQSDGATWWVS